MRAVIPFAHSDPKSRLAPVLSPNERASFARVMLEDVCKHVRDAGCRPNILATADIEDAPAPVIVDERPLSTAVNDHLQPPVAIVVADLAILTPTALRRAFDLPGDVVMAPGRGGGTNVLVVRSPAFSVDYHGMSLSDHRSIAERQGLELVEIDSHRLATDIDEPADLVEVLLHGEGPSAAWLAERGFRPVPADGRVEIERR